MLYLQTVCMRPGTQEFWGCWLRENEGAIKKKRARERTCWESKAKLWKWCPSLPIRFFWQCRKQSPALYLAQPLLSSLSCCPLLCYFFLQLTEIVRTLRVQNLCSYTLMILIIPSSFVPLQETVALRPLLHLSFSFQLFASGSSPALSCFH